MIPAFDDLRVRIVGACLLSGLLGFAAGNGHTTEEALKGSEQWWAQQEKMHLTVMQRAAWRQCMKDYGE